MNALRFVYFGGEPLGVPALEALEKAGLIPTVVVCNPDRPVGRKQILTAPPVKVWANERNIPVIQPESIPKDPTSIAPGDPLYTVTSQTWDLFVVVAYNHILPRWFIELPKHKTINLHPSLLPAFRGASPIRSAILADHRKTGVTVMLLDQKMDHGPILAQEVIEIAATDWPMTGPELDTKLGAAGGALLAKTIPAWMTGDITPIEQNHDVATYCGKVLKEMAEVEIDPYHLPSGEAAYQTYLKIQAYAGWPIAFFIHDGKRYKITAAKLDASGVLVIDTVIPEGKAEMSFSTCFR